MAEHIEKEALEKRIHTGMNIIEAMQAIMDAPAADVWENVRGEWIYLGDSEWQCSNCESLWIMESGMISEAFLFCPNCGADMRTKEDC